jgi:hypothetical protein
MFYHCHLFLIAVIEQRSCQFRVFYAIIGPKMDQIKRGGDYITPLLLRCCYINLFCYNQFFDELCFFSIYF